AVIGALARQLGCGAGEIECAAGTPASDDRWRQLGPFCTLTHSLPVFSIDACPGETFEAPALSGYRGPLGVIIGTEGGIGGAAAARAITIPLDLETPEQRERIWRTALNGRGGGLEIAEVAATFCLPGKYVRQCARLAVDYAALERRAAVTLPDL